MARGEGNDFTPVLEALVERAVEPRHLLLGDGDGYVENPPLPLRDDVTPSRFIFGWLVHKNRQFLVRHCPLSPQSDSASDSGARTAVNCKPLIIKGNLGLGLIKTSLPLGGVGRAVWPQIVRPVLSFARWYWAGLTKLPVFTLGYCVGVFVGAMLVQFPMLLRAASALAR